MSNVPMQPRSAPYPPPVYIGTFCDCDRSYNFMSQPVNPYKIRHSERLRLRHKSGVILPSLSFTTPVLLGGGKYKISVSKNFQYVNSCQERHRNIPCPCSSMKYNAPNLECPTYARAMPCESALAQVKSCWCYNKKRCKT